MDDILILAPTRWKLRKAVCVVNKTLASLGLEKHPDKTFIGRIDRGFDFLGYHFSRSALSAASKTIRNAIEKVSRLYEQGRHGISAPPEQRSRHYLKRWQAWLTGGLGPLDTSHLIPRTCTISLRF